MSIQNAIKFINRLDADSEFRKLFYKNTPSTVDNYLISHNLNFSTQEIEEAYRQMLLKCQSYKQAFQLHELVFVYQSITEQTLDIPSV